MRATKEILNEPSGFLYLSKPPFKNWALQFEGNSAITDIMRVKLQWALNEAFDGLNPFFQCNGATYLMIEFWSTDEDKILNTCMEFAAKYGYDLELR